MPSAIDQLWVADIILSWVSPFALLEGGAGRADGPIRLSAALDFGDERASFFIHVIRQPYVALIFIMDEFVWDLRHFQCLLHIDGLLNRNRPIVIGMDD